MLSKLLVTIAKQHKDRMAEKLRELDLFVGQDIFLLTLAQHGELSQTELKKRLKVEYSTIHKIASRLEKKGFVVKSKDTSDQRVSLIRLSEKGESAAEKIMYYWDELETVFFEPLNDKEKKQLQDLMEKLIT